MVIYTKDDAELRIPNAIGNINLTITEGGGDINLENYYTKNQVDNKFATKVGLNTVADNVNELNVRVSNLEENGGDINLENYYTKEECIVLANERTEYLEEKINESKEIEVVTVNDLNEVTKEKWNEIANTSNKIYVIEVVDTIMPINKKKYRVLFTKSDISFKYIYLGAFDENAFYLVTVNNFTVGISKIELGGGTSDGGNDIVYFDFDIENGEFNVNDDFNFKTVAQTLKENKIVCLNGCLVTSYFIDDYLNGHISIVYNNFITVYDATYIDFERNNLLVTTQTFMIPDEYEMNYINDELYNLNGRVSNLEKNSGCTPSGEGIPFTQEYLNLIYANEAQNFIQNTDINNLESKIEKLNKIKRVTYEGDLVDFDTFQAVAKDLRDGKEVWIKDYLNNLYPIVGFSPEEWDTERDLCGGWITMLDTNALGCKVKYYDGNYDVDDEGNVINTEVSVLEYDLMNLTVDLSNVEHSVLTAYNYNDYELENWAINYYCGDKNNSVTIVLDNGNGNVKKLFNASFKISEEKREVDEDNRVERIWKEGYLSAFDSATNTVYMWELTKENNYALTDEKWDNTYWDEYKTNPKVKIFTLNGIEYDVTNGMSSDVFDTIYNGNWKNVTLKNGADYAKVTSINTDQKSINSIIYDEYNGELYMYNYYLEGSSNVGTIKYKINMEIV